MGWLFLRLLLWSVMAVNIFTMVVRYVLRYVNGNTQLVMYTALFPKRSELSEGKKYQEHVLPTKLQHISYFDICTDTEFNPSMI